MYLYLFRIIYANASIKLLQNPTIRLNSQEENNKKKNLKNIDSKFPFSQNRKVLKSNKLKENTSQKQWFIKSP